MTRPSISASRGLLLALLLLLPTSALPAGETVRTVFIALDAVPYSTVAELADPRLGDDAILRGFHGPVPLISTFPSTTSLALAAILEPFGLELSPGYEAKHFDLELNRVRGGGLLSYNRLKFPWRAFFDWKREGLWKKMTSGLHPVKISLASIDESLDAFLRADDERYFIYYDATDLVGHLRSPDSLRPVLRHLDAKLREIRAEHPERPFHAVLFSDHGMAGGENLKSVRRDVLAALDEAGFRDVKELVGRNDVVFVPFGLVSSFVAFTQPGREVEAADAMAQAEGIELCVAPEGGGWRVEGPDGGARISRRMAHGAIEWAYRPLDGDPLGYAPIAQRLGDRSPGSAPRLADEEHLSDERWFSDEQWLNATRGEVFPDALHRLASGFELVRNPASVICSVAPGYMYGAATANVSARLSVGRLEWTHGALRKADSYGFLASDAPGWRADAPVRFDEALLPFVPAKSER